MKLSKYIGDFGVLKIIELRVSGGLHILDQVTGIGTEITVAQSGILAMKGLAIATYSGLRAHGGEGCPPSKYGGEYIT